MRSMSVCIPRLKCDLPLTDKELDAVKSFIEEAEVRREREGKFTLIGTIIGVLILFIAIYFKGDAT